MIRLTFELYPSDGQIYSFENPYGYIFRGIIMKWLNEIKSELVHKFHEYEVVRPYAFNSIIHRKIPKIDSTITSSHDDLSEALINDLFTSERNYQFQAEIRQCILKDNNRYCIYLLTMVKSKKSKNHDYNFIKNNEVKI